MPPRGKRGHADDSEPGECRLGCMRCPLVQINLVTKDMASAVEFYQLLGWAFEVTPDGVHAAAAVSPDLLVELDTAEFASVWNPAPWLNLAELCSWWRRMTGPLWMPCSTSSSTQDIVGCRPYDTFWGARFAVVADPDGHQVGLMSPQDEEARYWPPRRAPRDRD